MTKIHVCMTRDRPRSWSPIVAKHVVKLANGLVDLSTKLQDVIRDVSIVS